MTNVNEKMTEDEALLVRSLRAAPRKVAMLFAIETIRLVLDRENAAGNEYAPQLRNALQMAESVILNGDADTELRACCDGILRALPKPASSGSSSPASSGSSSGWTQDGIAALAWAAAALVLNDGWSLTACAVALAASDVEGDTSDRRKMQLQRFDRIAAATAAK